MRSGQEDGDGMSQSDNEKGAVALGEESPGPVPNAESLPESEVLNPAVPIITVTAHAIHGDCEQSPLDLAAVRFLNLP
jgi:hypothetical protein